MEILVTIKKMRENACLPAYATPGAAAADLYAAPDGPVTLAPGAWASIPTGVAVALPSRDYVALVFGRSGLGFAHGVTLVNAVGVIDADYRGEIAVGLINHGSAPYTVRPGDRIAQMAVMPIARADFLQAEKLPGTERGVGGFGSTGK